MNQQRVQLKPHTCPQPCKYYDQDAVLDLLITIIKEHEEKLGELISRLENL